MFGFNLSNLSEDKLIAAVDDLALKYGAGGVTPEPGGGPTTGLSDAYLTGTKRQRSDQGVVYLSDEYFKYYRVVLEEVRKRQDGSRALRRMALSNRNGRRSVLYKIP